DALAIDGVAVLGASVSASQASQIKAGGQMPIVMADLDHAGQGLIDAALVHGWRVAFPHADGWWESDVKDVAEAARRYGQLYALRAIVGSSTASPALIAAKRMMFVR
ncbi:hypothetical protein, partial [Falsiroseomonas tokyonensis]